MELSKKLVMLRKQQGLTQDELALKVGVTRQTVSKWERGFIAPSTVNLIALGRLYGIPLDELANGGMPPQEEPSAAVAVEEKTEAAEKRGKPGLLRIVGSVVLAGCILLITIASAFTIWSAVFEEPEKTKNDIIWTDEMEWEYVNPAVLVPFSDDEWIIIEE